VKHETDAKHRIEASVREGEVLAVTLYERERDCCLDLGAHLGPSPAHHLMRDVSADELQLSLSQPGEEPTRSTGQIKTAADGCAKGGSLVKGTLDRRKREAVSLLASRRQEA
jgi:hypothetical protein